MLDAILMEHWEFRYYSFNSRWGNNERMASMRDGSGSEYFAIITHAGVIIKGFDKDSSLTKFYAENHRSWSGLYSGAPKVFSDFLKEPAFSIDEATFCIWRQFNGEWEFGATETQDANELKLLTLFVQDERGYKTWADAYYEKDIPLTSISKIYSGTPLTKAIVRELNPHRNIDELQEDIQEIGYPTSGD